MFDIQTPVQNTLFLYMTLILTLLFIKPTFLFNENGKLKPFGCGNGKSLVNFPVFVIGCAILIYFTFVIVKQTNKYLKNI